MTSVADQFFWSLVLAAPLALLSLGFAGFLRLASRRRGNIARLPRRRGLLN